MWYFTWILGVGAALAFGIINVMWLEASYSFGHLDEDDIYRRFRSGEKPGPDGAGERLRAHPGTSGFQARPPRAAAGQPGSGYCPTICGLSEPSVASSSPFSFSRALNLSRDF